ncbi:MAG: dihydrofolate reductase [Mycoplasma sp.]
MLKLIVCMDNENGIGKDNKLPWNIKAEMQHFKNTTSGHTIVMGRKTFESIGRVLPNRKNIIFSNQNLSIEGATVTNSIEDVLKLSKNEDVYIIGGQQIYDLFINYCDELIVSRLNDSFECDTFFRFNPKFFTLNNTVKNEEFCIEYYKSNYDKILDGKYTSSEIKKQLQNKLNSLVKIHSVKPKLTIVQVGDNYASSVYIRNKIKLGNEIGIDVDHVSFSKDISQEDLIIEIKKLNDDKNINGILVQLPLPKHIDADDISFVIDPKKDVDCFNPTNVGLIWTNPNSKNVNTIPCTPMGVIEILKFNNVELESKNVVIIGRSNIVGKPLVSLFLANNSTVQICHSKTKKLEEICMNADILVAAIGIPKFINKNFIKEGAIVIDVGINSDENNKLCGDVDFFDVINKVNKITPVPMGIGPMTLIMLMNNIIVCYEKQMNMIKLL